MNILFLFSAKAAIYDWYGEERRAEYGRELNLTCRALGIPLPSVQWRKNGKSVSGFYLSLHQYIAISPLLFQN